MNSGEWRVESGEWQLETEAWRVRSEQLAVGSLHSRLTPRPSSLVRRARPRGLAPLEMVLSLPILLFVMALIINYGTVASWKVRGLSAARHAVWSSRWPRTPEASPRPEYWPPAARMTPTEAGNVLELDDPRVDLPVARGPLPNHFVVHERLLDPTRGLRQGNSHLEREFPLLARMGAYDLDARHRFLDDKWQYQRTNWPDEGELLPENAWRRIPVIYRLPRVGAWLVSAYTAAANAILGAPFRADLAPLETWKDDEFVGYALRFGWGMPRQDFHPGLQRFCTLDAGTADRHVQKLIDHIQGSVQRDEEGQTVRRIPSVAEQLTDAFIALYRRVIRELEAQSEAASATEAAGMQAEIAELESRISILERFRATLQGQSHES